MKGMILMETTISATHAKITISLFLIMMIIACLLGIYYNIIYRQKITALNNEMTSSRMSITKYLKEHIRNQNAIVNSFYDKKEYQESANEVIFSVVIPNGYDN